MEKILFPHILIYDSSAGSGKTHQLALRYIHLLLSSQENVRRNLSNILAITFTNKSSQEMRSRIIEWMKRILLDLPVSGRTEKKIRAELKNPVILNAKEYQPVLLPDKALLARIENVFNYLLKNYSDFKVSTIDSFVTLILKASAFKLGVSPDFQIAINVDPSIDIIIDKIFQDIVEKPETRNIFDKFIENYAFIRQDEIKWFPKDFIRDNIKSIWTQIKTARKNINYIQKEMNSFGNNKMDIEKDLKNRAGKFFENLQSELNEKKLIFNKIFLNKVQKYKEQYDIKYFDIFLKDWLEDNLNKGSEKPSRELSMEWLSIKSEISRYYESTAEYYYFHLIEIFQLFEKKLVSEIRYKGGTVLIQEINDLLREILNKAENDPEFLPELYYYLAARYFHFLIDEFQDTNYLQWQNLKILIDESISSGGSLFVVGDRKQAIYNWRGASSDLIGKVEGMFPVENIYRNTLDINYRSKPNLIWFFNRVFDADNLISNFVGLNKYFDEKDKEKVRDDFRNSAQKIPGMKNPDEIGREGYIFIKKIVQKEMVKEDIYEVIRDEFMGILKEVRERGIFRDRDICVLCRKRDEVDRAVNWLLEEKINVEADITVDIRNNPYIREIISLISFFNQPDNDFAFINVLSGDIFRNISANRDEVIEWYQKRLIKMSGQKEEALYRGFREDYPELWEEYFAYFFKVIGYLPVYEFILLLIKKWRIFRNFRDYSPYFLKLLEIIKHIESSGEMSIKNLLDLFVNENTPAELFFLNTGEGLNAVKVMTIHKSKGLEFPVVILPFCNIQKGGNNNMFFTEEGDYLRIFYINQKTTPFSRKLDQIYSDSNSTGLMEEINNLYVSFTRAKNELYVLLPETKTVVNPVVNLIYNHDKLKDFISDDVFQAGSLQEKKTGKEKEVVEEEFHEFDDIGDDLKWFELLRTKVIRAEEITKNKFYAVLKGRIIHDILSLIRQWPDESLDLKVRQSLARYNVKEDGGRTAEDIGRFLRMNFENKDFLRFFESGAGDLVFQEKEIAGENGILKRVDRFIVRKDRIEVIDFKTGEQYKEEHDRQIKEYSNLLKILYPEKKIHAFLCYMDEGLVKKAL